MKKIGLVGHFDDERETVIPLKKAMELVPEFMEFLARYVKDESETAGNKIWHPLNLEDMLEDLKNLDTEKAIYFAYMLGRFVELELQSRKMSIIMKLAENTVSFHDEMVDWLFKKKEEIKEVK